MREKCVMQKYYEASSQKCKDKRGSILVNGADITGYKERDMAKIRGKVFFHDFSGSYDVFKPNYKNRRADCRGNFNSPQEKTKDQVYKK